MKIFNCDVIVFVYLGGFDVVIGVFVFIDWKLDYIFYNGVLERFIF